MLKHTIVFGVHFPLLRVRCANHGLVAVFAAIANKKALTGIRLGLEIDDEIRVISILARAVGIGERREFQAACQLDQYFLKRFALALGRQNGYAH